MKSYNETIESIFSKGDAIIAGKNERIRSIKRTSAAVSGLCATAIVGFAIFRNDDLKNSGNLNSGNENVMTETETTASRTAETTVSTSKKAASTSSSAAKTTSHTSAKNTSISTTKDITQTPQETNTTAETLAETTSSAAEIIHTTEPTTLTTALTAHTIVITTPENTSVSAHTTAITNMTETSISTEVTTDIQPMKFNDEGYELHKNTVISWLNAEFFLGITELQTDEGIVEAEVYSLKNVSSQSAVLVTYSERIFGDYHQNIYYLYKKRSYSPSSLDVLISDNDLINYSAIHSVALYHEGTEYSPDISDTALWDILLGGENTERISGTPETGEKLTEISFDDIMLDVYDAKIIIYDNCIAETDFTGESLYFRINNTTTDEIIAYGRLS